MIFNMNDHISENEICVNSNLLHSVHNVQRKT